MKLLSYQLGGGFKAKMSFVLLTCCFVSIFPVFFAFSYFKFKLHSRYIWKRMNIPYMEPTYLFGNCLKVGSSESYWEIVQKYYMENRDKPLLGTWFYTMPILLVQDLNLVRNMLVKDFEHFHDRGLPVVPENDPLGGHLFHLTGTKWRNLRATLTPTFSSGKIKMMFQTMTKIGKELQLFLEKAAENEKTVEWKDTLARFTTDIIASCVFGIQTNSLKNPGEEFKKNAEKIFAPGFWFTVYMNIMMNLTFLKKILPFHIRPREVTDFFINSVEKTIEHREKYNIKRNDFMDLIIQLKNEGKVDGADDSCHFGVTSVTEFTDETAAAQAYIFFLGGFETSHTIMTFAFYELATNLGVQKKLQNEIDKILAKYSNEITYEAVQEMEYLDCVVNETLRKYPPGSTLPRKCTKDYTFPGTQIRIKKGTFTIIPVIGIHNDPEYFPNPQKFDPDRFTAEEKSKRDKFLQLAFGEGPRMCIGKRFGLMMVKTALIFVMMKYNVEISEKTQIPVKMDPMSLVPSPYKRMELKITTRI